MKTVTLIEIQELKQMLKIRGEVKRHAVISGLPYYKLSRFARSDYNLSPADWMTLSNSVMVNDMPKTE